MQLILLILTVLNWPKKQNNLRCNKTLNHSILTCFTFLNKILDGPWDVVRQKRRDFFTKCILFNYLLIAKCLLRWDQMPEPANYVFVSRIYINASNLSNFRQYKDLHTLKQTWRRVKTKDTYHHLIIPVPSFIDRILPNMNP